MSRIKATIIDFIETEQEAMDSCGTEPGQDMYILAGVCVMTCVLAAVVKAVLL